MSGLRPRPLINVVLDAGGIGDSPRMGATMRYLKQQKLERISSTVRIFMYQSAKVMTVESNNKMGQGI